MLLRHLLLRSFMWAAKKRQVGLVEDISPFIQFDVGYVVHRPQKQMCIADYQYKFLIHFLIKF